MADFTLYDANAGKPVPTMTIGGREFYVLPIHKEALAILKRLKQNRRRKQASYG